MLFKSIKKLRWKISLHVLTFNSIFVKVPEYDSKPYMNISHSNGMKSVTVSTTVYQVGVFQLRSSSQKILWHLFLETPRGPPGWAFNFMHAWRCGHMTETISIQFISSKGILMPYLKVNFWPTCKFIILHRNVKSMEIKKNYFDFLVRYLSLKKEANCVFYPTLQHMNLSIEFCKKTTKESFKAYTFVMLCTVYSESSSLGHFYSVEPEMIIVLLQVWRLIKCI